MILILDTGSQHSIMIFNFYKFYETYCMKNVLFDDTDIRFKLPVSEQDQHNCSSEEFQSGLKSEEKELFTQEGTFSKYAKSNEKKLHMIPVWY